MSNDTKFSIVKGQTRRRLIITGAGVALVGAAANYAFPDHTYERMVAHLYAGAEPASGAFAAQCERFIFYGSLAANSHNSQPWRFRLRSDGIEIYPDFARRTPVVDPDDHHLWVSLGAAVENICVAAEASGYAANASHMGSHLFVGLDKSPSTVAVASPLFTAIPERQCSRSIYDGRPTPVETIDRLTASASGLDVNLFVIEDAGRRREALDFVLAGNSAQMSDPEYLAELLEWLRFNEAQAVKTCDGLFSATSGNPTIPSLVGRAVFPFVFNADAENAKYEKQIKSSSFLMAFVGQDETPEAWVNVGRACQRIALALTAEGLSYAFINQPIEVAGMRSGFARFLGAAGRRPDLLVRVGHGPKLPRSLRRPITQIIDASAQTH